MTQMHRYRTDLVWSGSTGVGYTDHRREHLVSAPPGDRQLQLSSDPAFGGRSDLLNPEQLLLAAASSCQLLSFLALAARRGVDVVHYEDDAEAVMPQAPSGMRITRITLRPQVVVAEGTDLETVLELVRAAHDACYVANTLAAEVVLEPSVEHVGAAAAAPPGGVGSGS